MDQPTVVQLMHETQQAPALRRGIYEELESYFESSCVLLYFTSAKTLISDSDADIIESVLQKSDLSSGLTLIINSGGGDGLAAERIINVCRSYADGCFDAVVPKMAKSAATMICFGGKKIWMSQTAELGPIDPQVAYGDRVMPAYSIVESYKELMKNAATTQGNVAPYLQQLMNYDPSQIKWLETAQRLSEDIAVKALSQCMMEGAAEDVIRKCIKPFTDPKITGAHGRMIGLNGAASCKLNVQEIPLQSELWKALWELYVRADWRTRNRSPKMIETKDLSFETDR